MIRRSLALALAAALTPLAANATDYVGQVDVQLVLEDP